MALSGSARVLVMVEQPLIVEVIKLTLNHGVYVTREAQDVAEAKAALGEWSPHMAVIDMDIGGSRLLEHLAGQSDGRPLRTPVLALTRRGDLKTKLTAFERGQRLTLSDGTPNRAGVLAVPRAASEEHLTASLPQCTSMRVACDHASSGRSSIASKRR